MRTKHGINAQSAIFIKQFEDDQNDITIVVFCDDPKTRKTDADGLIESELPWKIYNTQNLHLVYQGTIQIKE